MNVNSLFESKNNGGLIIIGYQGIGKSTVGKAIDRVIDFDSSLFYIDDDRINYWYKIYCAQAVSLAKQGYTVMVSSHKFVRDELSLYGHNNFDIRMIYPHIGLKEQWIKRLHNRFLKTNFNKDHRAYLDAYQNYEVSIRGLENDNRYESVCLETMDYDLREIINLLEQLVTIERQIKKSKNE